MPLDVKAEATRNSLNVGRYRLHALSKHRLSIIGLGYVGAVSTACLAERGHYVHGVDLDPAKVGAIAGGEAPIVENELGDLLRAGVQSGQITASRDTREAVLDTDVTLVSVGTPTSDCGGCDFSALASVARDIGAALRDKAEKHWVVLRCSVAPGATLDIFAYELEQASGKRLGEGFDVAFNPEFLREGTAVADFRDPPVTVLGMRDPGCANEIIEIFHAGSAAPIITDIASAEMVKYACNVWHATKVAFANEIGRLCASMHIDSREVMAIFAEDFVLNISKYYLRPGFAFGGSCLPKEVRATSHIGHLHDVPLPLIDSLIYSNAAHVRAAETKVLLTGAKRVGLIGATFKPDTDDVRESPLVELAARLTVAGLDVRIFDPNLSSNARDALARGDVLHEAPDLADAVAKLSTSIVDSEAELIAWADAVVVGHAGVASPDLLASRRHGTPVVDLDGRNAALDADPFAAGLCW